MPMIFGFGRQRHRLMHTCCVSSYLANSFFVKIIRVDLYLQVADAAMNIGVYSTVNFFTFSFLLLK